MPNVIRDLSLSAIVAGFIAVVIAYASSAVIIFHAAQVAGLSNTLTASWIASASFASGLLSLWLSYRLRMPIITAWSTPGAALLVTALPLYSLEQAIGAYIISAILVMIFGFTGWFAKLMAKIPMSVISAMLAGILLQFCLQAFLQIQLNPTLALSMCVVYFISKVILPRYSIVLTLILGAIIVFLQQQLITYDFAWSVTQVQITLPEWSLGAVFGLALPLFVVAMTSQNASGLAVMKTSGYQAPESKLIGITGVMSLVSAPFGCHGVGMSAITAAICTSTDCHANVHKRYIAGLSCGVCYIIFAICAQSMVQLFAIVPKSFIILIAGLALFSACASSLKMAMSEAKDLDSAMLAFLVTASGFSIFGIGSAFWGLTAGLALYYFMKKLKAA